MDLTLKAITQIYTNKANEEIKAAVDCNREYDYAGAASHVKRAADLQDYIKYELTETPEPSE